MENFTWKSVMKYRNFFFGFAAVWIVFFHIRDMVKEPEYNFFTLWLFLGSIGVDIFLFLSAVGLSFSIEKNSLKAFFKNRFLRLWVPFLIICVPYYMWRDSVTGITPERVACFILDSTAINFWLKPRVPFWYVSMATAMYLFYPLLYRLHRKSKACMPALAVICIIAEIILLSNGIWTHMEKALSRIPIVLMGIYMSDIIRENRKIKKKDINLCAVVVVICLALYYFTALYIPMMAKRMIYACATVPIIVVVAYLFERFSKSSAVRKTHNFFCFFGGMSLELYLVHNAITRVLKYYNLTNFAPYTYYLWIFPVSAVLAIMYNKIASAIVKKIN